MSDYFTPIDSTVTGALFCYYKTYTEHDSNQPSMQKQRSVWCTGTSVQANISCLDPFRFGSQKTCNKKKYSSKSIKHTSHLVSQIIIPGSIKN